MPADAPSPLRARLVALAMLATAGLVAFLILRRTQVELALHLYLVLIGSVAATALAASAPGGLRALEPPSLLARIRGRRRRRPEERVRSLEELEHAVDFATTTAFDVHYRLRPHLVRIARHRLSARHGVLLEADPDAARRLVGPDVWELVRPDREPPANRNAGGLPAAELRGVVEALEAL